MPVISTLGAASSRGFGEFNQSTQANYIENFFNTYLYTGTGANQGIPTNIPFSTTEEWKFFKFREGVSVGYYIATDSSGNFYITGSATKSGVVGFVAKYNSSGSLQWQRYFSGGATSSYGNSVAVDSSGNVYISGVTNGSNRIIKYDSSGVLQWGRLLYEGANNVGTGIAVSVAGDVYSTGQAFDGSLWYALITKHNSSGTLQWQRKFYYTANIFSTGIALDSSDNVYICAQANDGTRNNAALIKYNSSGTFQWRRARFDSFSSATGVATDSSGNIYVSGDTNDGASKGLILKYDSSGTLQWQRKLSSTTSGKGVTVDSDGNPYLLASGAGNGIIVKYNSSGTIQWSNQFAQGTSQALNAAIDSSNNLYIIGYASDSSGTYAVIIKSKTNGNTSGILDIYLTPSTVTDAAGTTTDNGFGSSTTAAITEFTGAPTDAAGTATTSSSTQPAVISGGPGGLVWIKGRSGATDHALYDTSRGAKLDIASNLTTGQTTQTTGLTGFSASGFAIGSLAKLNTNTAIYAAWTFREQAKFFDVVTYTGNGANRTISHNLGSVPGMILIKRTDTTGAWPVYHRSLANTEYLVLNTTAAKATGATYWNSTTPTSTVFSLGTATDVNASGGTYVAYLFASNAGGFGADGSQNVISCGSFTTDGSGNATVNLGYEPQFLLFKQSSVYAEDWYICDTMRGWDLSANDPALRPNTSGAESNVTGGNGNPTSTGFSFSSIYYPNATYIYMAIRRGPMRTPTSGTSVFSPITSATGTGAKLTTNFVVDSQWTAKRGTTDALNTAVDDRLRGVSTTATASGNYLVTSTISSESTASAITRAWDNTGFQIPAYYTGINTIYWNFARAPNFMDIVCYTGNGAVTTINHNLGAIPELMIIKSRSSSSYSWSIYSAPTGNGNWMQFDAYGAFPNSGFWNNTSPTSSVFTVGTVPYVNDSGTTYVAYLFASCPNVSKIGSYTGTGSTQTINCGFSGGARFVLIKRTDDIASGNSPWYVWDTARGMVSGTDPSILWNTNSAEVNANSVYTTTGGFQVVSTVAGLNASGGTYIYLAIA